MPGGSPETTPEPVLTGERTWPGIPSEMYWFSRHLACYEWAATKVATQGNARASILDAGAGEGYGSRVLADSTSGQVAGAELDLSTMAHLVTNYPEVSGVVANLVALPFRTGAFTAAVSLQVIEHIWDPETYIRELDRCSSGPIVISTPNRPVHSPGLGPGEDPTNPFHVREFDGGELVELLTCTVPHRAPSLFGIQHGPRISDWEQRHGSLPQRLMSDDTDAALQFSTSVRAGDFEIVPIEVDAPVLDLIAVL